MKNSSIQINFDIFLIVLHIDAFDKRDVMQNGSVRIGRTEVSVNGKRNYKNP